MGHPQAELIVGLGSLGKVGAKAKGPRADPLHIPLEVPVRGGGGALGPGGQRSGSLLPLATADRLPEDASCVAISSGQGAAWSLWVLRNM